MFHHRNHWNVCAGTKPTFLFIAKKKYPNFSLFISIGCRDPQISLLSHNFLYVEDSFIPIQSSLS